MARLHGQRLSKEIKTGCGSQHKEVKGGKKGRLIDLHLTSEAVVYDLFVYYFYYTAAIASRVFLSGAGVWIL